MSLPCRDCIAGHVHEGTAQGKITKLHGLDTYVVEPKAGVKPQGLVVMLHDGLGLPFINNQLLADKFAKNGGFLVYLPDFYDGRPIPTHLIPVIDKISKPKTWLETFSIPFYIFQVALTMVPFIIRTRESVCKPRVLSFFQALRTSPPPFETNDLKIGAAGFCWGGKYTVLLAQDNPSSRVHRNAEQSSSQALLPLIDCGFTAHPSSVSVPKDIEKVVLPLSVAIGDVDMMMSGPKILQMREILEKKKAGDHEVCIMPGAKHGFTARMDPSDKHQVECAAKAEEQAINWFRRWFG
ncbi:hypothetical protein BP6252_03049 [Coleophoma cylindrospora]|uniref:Dienelactone hydrolase domain-containing protein n=1 Tax=Coleophoma cylindrospora TaxID=1849047 RepID=A0A3D8S6K0_9HELO|nr:hypothetical protein BP6252_03049 [Coleophoma cylindrospora]